MKYFKLNINQRINLKSWYKMLCPKTVNIIGTTIVCCNESIYMSEHASRPYLNIKDCAV